VATSSFSFSFTHAGVSTGRHSNATPTSYYATGDQSMTRYLYGGSSSSRSIGGLPPMLLSSAATDGRRSLDASHKRNRCIEAGCRVPESGAHGWAERRRIMPGSKLRAGMEAGTPTAGGWGRRWRVDSTSSRRIPQRTGRRNRHGCRLTGSLRRSGTGKRRARMPAGADAGHRQGGCCGRGPRRRAEGCPASRSPGKRAAAAGPATDGRPAWMPRMGHGCRPPTDGRLHGCSTPDPPLRRGHGCPRHRSRHSRTVRDGTSPRSLDAA